MARITRIAARVDESGILPTMEMKDGQRIEVLLCRGFADEWVGATVLDHREQKVELEEDVPGLPRIVTEPDICDWRPVSANPARPRRSALGQQR